MMPIEQLAALALDELPADEREKAELHLFSCTACAERLTGLLRMGAALQQLARAGQLTLCATEPLLDALTRNGLVTRTYRLGPGESVACTTAPEDLYVAGVLGADLTGLQRVDVIIDETRVVDVPFDPEHRAVVFLNSADALRSRGTHVQRLTLVGIRDSEELQLGTYVFNHAAEIG